MLIARLCRWASRIAVLVVALSSVNVLAQQGTGSIGGKILDSTGAAIPDAVVTITNQSTLTGTVLKSNAEGVYASQPLNSGLYTVEAEREGFRSVTQKDIELNDDQHAAVDLTLQPGSTSEQVEVQANAPLLNSFNATLGSVIDNATAESLPLNGSTALGLAQLDPGVISGFGPGNQGFNDRGTGVSFIRIGGGLVGSNGQLLDGANNLQTTRGEVLINSTVTGIQEMRLQYGVVSAAYGLTSGGMITMTTKAGTPSYHGQIYEYFRNDALDASGYFALQGSKPALRYNQYGAGIGGPIIKDKAFFFTNYEAYGLTQVTPIIITVPTVNERSGDFSALIAPGTNCTQSGGTTASPNQAISGCIYDPTSSATTRTPYSGNKIDCSTQCDAAALAFQKQFIPLPNLGNPSTQVNNYITNAPLISSQRIGNVRIDWQVSHHLSFFGRYAFYENITNNEGSYGSLPLLASTRNDDLRNQDLTFGLTQVISPTMLNDIRIAVGRSYFPFTAGSTGGNWPQQLGMSNVPENTLPAISISNYSGITVATNQGLRTSLVPEINDTLTILHGLHSLHLGAGLRFYESYNNSNTAPSGSFSFSSSVTGQTGAASSITGNGYASFLIGKTSSVTATASAPSVARSFGINGFIQDDWRILPNLTLNLGLRYDYQMIPWEKSNGFSTLKLDQIDPANGLQGCEVYAGVNGEPSNFAAENYHDLGPRVGFALLLSQRHHSVLRGGYALYYASASNIVYSNATDGFGTNTTTSPPPTTDGYVSDFQTGLPRAVLGLPGAGGGPGALLGQSPNVQPQAAPTSASQQFVLSFDHQFAGNTVLSISALQNHGTHFPMTAINLNQLNPVYFSLGQTFLEKSTTNPYANDGITGSLGNATMQVLQKLKPYPYFQNVYLYYPHIGSYLGRTFQMQVRRPISMGLQMQLGYAYGKLLSDPLEPAITAPPNVSSQLQNSWAPHSEYGIDTSDVTHRVSGNLTYALPFGRGMRYFANTSTAMNQLIGGWNLAGTVVAESGRPLAITGSNGKQATRPDFVPGVSLKVAHPNANEWFNTAAFTAAPPYTFGNVPRTLSQLRGPGALELDMNLQKAVKFERFTGEFQLSAYNVLNKTNFGTPNTGYVNPTTASATTTTSAFGSITTTLQARILQATLRFRF